MTKKETDLETYHGVHRNEIPWGPTINYEKCVNCGRCVDYCHMDVYELEEKNGKNRSVVKNPIGCVVFCKGCQDICPAHAISHPSRKETRELILKLKRQMTS
jgi:NAD-dependent dihydropyrimidine dehydrogenase PreA subunit